MTTTFKPHDGHMVSALQIGDYEARLYPSIESVKTIWDAVAPTNNLFLQTKFLAILEAAPPKGMQMRYLVFFKEGQAEGIAYCQVQNFKAEDSVKIEDGAPSPCFFSTIARNLRGFVAKKVEFYTLLCGNLLLTGEHGYHFNTPDLNGKKGMNLLHEGLDFVTKELAKEKISVAAILIKDFYEEHRPELMPLLQNGYNEFTIQPSMVFHLDASWNSYEDYLAAMSSKYRVRCKKAGKCAKDIIRKEMDLEEVESQLPKLYQLYEEIAKNSGFNVLNLNSNYLLELKKRIPEEFIITGYYLEGELIAYYTTILNGKELEAHFLGFNNQYNRKYQIYLNILLDIARRGIECGAEEIVYARTALEIKSSVGAVAHEMYCYMRHRNSLSNRLVKSVVEYLRPTEEWIPRRPFKEKKVMD